MTTLQLFMFCIAPPILIFLIYNGWQSDRRRAEIDRYIENCRRGVAEREEKH